MVLININGSLVEENNAFVSIKDRGFRFGDGIFDTIKIVNGRVFRYDLYESRIKAGLAAVRIDYDISQLDFDISRTVAANDIKNGFARVSITRGSGSRGYLPTHEGKPTMVIEAMEFKQMQQKDGGLMVSSYQKPSLEVLPVNFKLMQGLNSTLAKMEARDNGFYDSLLLNHKGQVCECSSSNIFWIKAGKIYTPSLEVGCLKGIIRELIIESFEVLQGLFSLEDIKQADEVFITNSLIEVFPIFEIKGIFKNEAGKYPETEVVLNKIRELISQTGR